jgi:crotonobetainyl-CoA:carnitine CoA-transferase CaiB-like acyl-CoA transferase
MTSRPFLDSPTQLKVLDLGTQVAGPFAATLLGDLGAEVIKIEQPGTGDPGRGVDGMSPRWQVDGRNKRSITLNLRTAEGQDILRRLAGWADILVENFRPGVMDRWGIGYEALNAIHPGLVYVAISGFGASGPYSGLSGYDYVGSAVGGMTALTGDPGQPPVTPGLYVTDHSAGLFGALGALEAVRRRDAPGGDGLGAYVDLALYEAVLRYASTDLVDYSLNGAVRQRAGGSPRRDGHPEMTVWYAYRTQDGRYLSISPVTMGQITDLRNVIQDEALLDPDFESLRGRMDKAAAFYDIIERWVGARDFDEVWARLSATSVPVGPVNTIPDIVADPHIRARGSLVTLENADGRPITMPAATPRIGEAPLAPRWTGERLGASNAQVYSELLGFSDPEIEGLQARGVI